MHVRVEGTGTPEGLPVAGCPCVTCRAAVGLGERRRPLSAVVDEHLVLTADPDLAVHGVEPVGAGAWSVTSGHERLLWSPDGRLPDRAGAAYDVILLGMGEGLPSWALRIAELRRQGAVRADTRLHAVAIGHAEPPPNELHRTLALWGATAPSDGDVLHTAASTGSSLRPPRVLVLGGARSGKSAYAELRLAAEPAVLYVATAPDRADDAEWQERIRVHVARRPPAWQTLETAEVAAVLTGPDPVLIDDLGLWLVQLLDRTEAWTGALPAEVRAGIDELVTAWQTCTTGAVLVAPQVGGGVVPATPSGRLFRDLLGTTTARLAQHSDDVVQVVAGLPRVLR